MDFKDRSTQSTVYQVVPIDSNVPFTRRLWVDVWLLTKSFFLVNRLLLLSWNVVLGFSDTTLSGFLWSVSVGCCKDRRDREVCGHLDDLVHRVNSLFEHVVGPGQCLGRKQDLGWVLSIEILSEPITPTHRMRELHTQRSNRFVREICNTEKKKKKQTASFPVYIVE